MASHQQFSLTSYRICSTPKLRQTCADTNRQRLGICFLQSGPGIIRSLPNIVEPTPPPPSLPLSRIWPPETCLQVLQASRAPGMWGLWDQYNLAQTLNVHSQSSMCLRMSPINSSFWRVSSSSFHEGWDFIWVPHLISFHLFSKCKLWIFLSISLDFTFSLLYSSFSLPLPT